MMFEVLGRVVSRRRECHEMIKQMMMWVVGATLWASCASETGQAGSGAMAVTPQEIAAPTPHVGAARPVAPTTQAPRVAWRWVHYGPDAISRGAHEQREVVEGDDTIRLHVISREEGVVVTRVAADGAERWRYTMERAPMLTRAMLIDAGDLVVLAVHSYASSGGSLLGLDRRTGELRWSKRLEALGPVAHSEYRNEIQLALIDARVVVFGDEAEGRYVEQVEISSGKTLSNERLDAKVPRLEPARIDSIISSQLEAGGSGAWHDALAMQSLKLARPLQHVASPERGVAAGLYYKPTQHEPGAAVVLVEEASGEVRWRHELLGFAGFISRGLTSPARHKLMFQGPYVVALGALDGRRYIESLDIRSAQVVAHEVWVP
jgi:hypothetical protein